MFDRYFNNPAGTVTDILMFRKIVDFASQHDLIVCHDTPHT